ncbi:MAG: hypothetical protein H0W06_11240 [Chloroflexia bacterium]|nr:hypothetical protein [Chloroflexia bacterium]
MDRRLAEIGERQGELRVRIARADVLEATLLSILGLVNDWLKFAETKNGGVVGQAGAANVPLVRFLSDTAERDTMTTGERT